MNYKQMVCLFRAPMRLAAAVAVLHVRRPDIGLFHIKGRFLLRAALAEAVLHLKQKTELFPILTQSSRKLGFVKIYTYPFSCMFCFPLVLR